MHPPHPHRTVRCPNCGRPVAWGPGSSWQPFCSERCRLVDLGGWLSEAHRISQPADTAVPDGTAPKDHND
jgi:uncharacterized protein